MHDHGLLALCIKDGSAFRDLAETSDYSSMNETYRLVDI
jgi:hypothetical protein